MWLFDNDMSRFLTPEEHTELGAKSVIYGCFSLVLIVIMFVAVVLLTGCGTTKVVTVPEVHERWHTRTDTVRQTDSIIDHQTTLIREVDSATMASYGIRLKDMQRAWLIETDRMQRELSRLRETKTDTVVRRDSIPYPVEVIKEVARPFRWWQEGLMVVGAVAVVLLGGVVVLRLNRN